MKQTAGWPSWTERKLTIDADATYRMSGQEFSCDELIAALDAEAATLDPDQWEGGWDAHEYLIEALLVGVIERVYSEGGHATLPCSDARAFSEIYFDG